MTLRDYVNWGITHCDKTGSAEGVPLVMENCVKNKRMKQLEVYGNSVQNGIPTPETPIEVESVGEKCTKNIFNKDNIVYHGGINSMKSSLKSTTTGISYNVTSPGSTNSIFIKFGEAADYAGKWLTFTSTDYYSRNTAIVIKNAAAGSSTVLSGSLATSDGNGLYYSAIYVEEGIYTDEVLVLRLYGDAVSDVVEYSNIMVSVGEVPEKYEPYGKYKIPVTARGKNIFNCKNSKSLYNGYVSGGSIQTTDSDISWVSQNGGTSAVHMDMGLLSQYVGKQLTLSFEIELVNGESVGSTRFVVCTEKGQERTAVNGSISTKNGRRFITSTIPSRNENDHLTLRLYISSANPYTTYTFKNVMVSVMPGDVGFEPYVEPITTNIYLDEPLRKIGDYADVLDFKNKKVVRSVYECIVANLDSKKYNISQLNISTELVGFRYAYRGDMLRYKMPSIYVKGNSMCNMYPIVYSSQRADKTLSGGSSNCATFDLIDMNYTTVDEWVAHLQELYDEGTPLKVTHAIATPYEETIECELPTLTAKTSIVEIDTTLLPSNIKGKYIKR